MIQTVCYLPTHSTTRNHTITHCTAWYYTKYTWYYVGLLRYIRNHDVVPRYIRYKRCLTYRHTVQREITHYALHGWLLHKVNVVPRRTIQVHTVPWCSTEIHTVQTVCYVPTHSTTRNYTITHCTVRYYTKYTRCDVGLLRYIWYKRCVTYRHTVQCEITPLRTARRGITQSTRGTTSDSSGTYSTTM